MASGWGFRRRPSLSDQQWGLVVSGLGVAFGVVEVFHILEMSMSLGTVVAAVLPFLGSLALVAAGYLLWTGRYVYDDVEGFRVVGWTVVGMAGMAGIFLWILYHQVARGGHFHHALFILVNNLVVGGLIGFVIGSYDARNRAYQRSLRRERLKHDFLNRELRHHVLNGMQVILGRADALERNADSPPPEAIATIRQWGEEIEDRVESVRRVAQLFTEEGPASLDERDLSIVLADTVERVDARYEDASVSTDVPDGVTVCADEYLAAVFENLLTNAIEHNDADAPRVRVTASVDEETAVVAIADNGPGMPASYKESLSRWEEPPGEDTRTGVGLAIVNVLVDRYDGRVWVEDNDPTGTVASVELRRECR